MRSILSDDAAPVLDAIARAQSFLAFDFDGTLAPIVEDRHAAFMRDETRDLLRATALLYPCAVVSGRARSDVAARVADVRLEAVVGNHGAEPGFGPLDRSMLARVRRWADELRPALEPFGVDLEDKHFSIALHYRGAPSRDEAERRIRGAVSTLRDAVVFEGHDVVNVVPAGAPTKGDALLALCARVSAERIVYVGDDTTDEDAFRCASVAVSIRVGATAPSAASWRLDDQRGIDELLRRLIDARSRLDAFPWQWQSLVRAVRT